MVEINRVYAIKHKNDTYEYYPFTDGGKTLAEVASLEASVELLNTDLYVVTDTHGFILYQGTQEEAERFATQGQPQK